MKILDRYIAREVLGAWLLGVGWFTSISYALFVLPDVARRAAKWEVTASQITQLLLLEVPHLVALTLPVGMLYGSLMAFARFTNDGEIGAMLTSGVSFYRLMPSVLALGVLGSVATIALNETVVPPTQRASGRIIAQIEGKTDMAVWMREPTDLYRPAQRILSAERYIPRLNAFVRPVVVEYRNRKVERIVSAEKGIPLRSEQEDRWTFINARIVQFLPRQAVVTRAKRCEMRLGKTPQQMQGATRPVEPDEMNLRELWEYYNAVRRVKGTSRQYLNELTVALHNKLSLPLSCLVVGLLGPPLALRRQRTSSSVGFGISFLLIVGYFALWTVATLLGKKGGMNPALSSWLADIVGALAGLVLIWRAGR